MNNLTKFSRKVDDNNRITLPSEIKKELDVNPGDSVAIAVVEIDNKKYVILEKE